MKWAKSLFILLFIIFLLSFQKSSAQLITSSNYKDYNQKYSSFPFLIESFSNIYLNPYILNYDLQAFLWSSSTYFPLFQCYPHYDQPFHFWYNDFSNQSLEDLVSTENPKEQSFNEDSEEIKIIIKDDNGKAFTFHVGDEFIVRLCQHFWPAFFGTMGYAWSEGEEINLENGYGFINKNGEKVKEVSEYYEEFHYQAIQPGENELVLNCYIFPFPKIPLEGPSFLNPDQEMADDITIVDTFRVIIQIID